MSQKLGFLPTVHHMKSKLVLSSLRNLPFFSAELEFDEIIEIREADDVQAAKKQKKYFQRALERSGELWSALESS